MPNHVSHCIVISGYTSKQIKDRYASDDGDFDFSKLIPVPDYVYQGNLSFSDKDDFKENWYDWNIKNWGTKWNCYESSIKDSSDGVVIEFYTAWSIPYPIIVALANQLKSKKMTHEYYDEGSNFWGREVWSGQIRESKDTDEELKKELCIKLKGYDPSNIDEDE